MARATLNTGESLHAVNDLFIGPRSHTSARYFIEHAGARETHSSSGVIVSTGLGSTGWLKSLLAGATGIVEKLSSPGGTPPKEKSKRPPAADVGGFPWDAAHLCFTVREPFPSRTTQTSIVFGQVTRESPLILVSQMPDAGVIFSDGIETDFLEFRSGTRAVIGPAERQGRLVV